MSVTSRPSVRRLACAASLIALAAGAGPALAQANDDAIAEVIVTAQKRQESAQSVPIAITAVAGEQLAASNIATVTDLERLVPSLKMNQKGGPVQPFVRGVGTSSSLPGQESPVAVYIDDVYILSAQAAAFNLNSVERIEVLKGPQGTLFGRNALAGVLNVYTREPTAEPRIDAEVGYASYQTVSARLYGSAGVSDTLAANIAVTYQDRGKGWGRNPARNTDAWLHDYLSARGKLKWTPGEDLNVTLTGWYDWFEKDNNNMARRGAVAAGGFVQNTGFYDVYKGDKTLIRNDGGGVSLKIDYDLGWASVVNIAAFQESNATLLQDGDFQPARIQYVPQGWTETTYTNELQLISGPDGRFTWLVGLFLMDAAVDQTQTIVGSSLPAGRITDTTLDTTSIAPFGQATFEIFEGTRLTAGLRYTRDRREFTGTTRTVAGAPTGAADRKKTFEKVTWRLSLGHDVNDQLMVYGSYNRGFKSGTFQMSSLTAPQLLPETIDAFEVGFKSRLLDRRAILNASAFHYDYKNVIARGQLPTTILVNDLFNAASATAYGLDVDAQLRLDRLTLSGGASWLYSEYDRFPNATALVPRPSGGNATVLINAAGNRLPQAPRMTLALGAIYDAPLPEQYGSLTLAASVDHRTRVYFEPDNLRPQGPTTVLNANVKWASPDDRWGVTVWARNLGDERYYLDFAGSATVDGVSPAEPRTVGVTLTYSMGGR